MEFWWSLRLLLFYGLCGPWIFNVDRLISFAKELLCFLCCVYCFAFISSDVFRCHLTPNLTSFPHNCVSELLKTQCMRDSVLDNLFHRLVAFKQKTLIRSRYTVWTLRHGSFVIWNSWKPSLTMTQVLRLLCLFSSIKVGMDADTDPKMTTQGKSEAGIVVVTTSPFFSLVQKMSKLSSRSLLVSFFYCRTRGSNCVSSNRIIREYFRFWIGFWLMLLLFVSLWHIHTHTHTHTHAHAHARAHAHS